MTSRPERQRHESNWFVEDSKGFAWLPWCSPDYQPTTRRNDTCLLDPFGPICRCHRNFFRTRKAAP